MLLATLQDHGVAVPDVVLSVGRLTPFAVEARYPSVAREVTSEQYEDAVALAAAVVAWAEAQIESAI